MSDQYIPGSCNIGQSEIRRRQLIAVIGAISTISGAIHMFNNYASRTPRLALFIPAMVFSAGWVQSRKKFCLAYGFMGVFNFGKAGKAQKVRSDEEKKADFATAKNLLSHILVLTLAITGLLYFWPA